MAVTEQLNIRLEPSEKKQVSAAAKADGVSVSEYVRRQLFGDETSPADELLFAGLVALRPELIDIQKRISSARARLQRVRLRASLREDGIDRRAAQPGQRKL